jgi:hypothetical protein
MPFFTPSSDIIGNPYLGFIFFVWYLLEGDIGDLIIDFVYVRSRGDV